MIWVFHMMKYHVKYHDIYAQCLDLTCRGTCMKCGDGCSFKFTYNFVPLVERDFHTLNLQLNFSDR